MTRQGKAGTRWAGVGRDKVGRGGQGWAGGGRAQGESGGAMAPNQPDR